MTLAIGAVIALVGWVCYEVGKDEGWPSGYQQGMQDHARLNELVRKSQQETDQS